MKLIQKRKANEKNYCNSSSAIYGGIYHCVWKCEYNQCRPRVIVSK